MDGKQEKAATGYDKYVNHKTFAIAVGAFFALMLIPIPASMMDVAVEYSAGEAHTLEFISQELFSRPFYDLEQWQAMTTKVLESNMRQGAFTRRAALARNSRHIEQLGISAPDTHVQRFHEFVEAMDDDEYRLLIQRAHHLRHEQLTYEALDENERAQADTSAFHLKVCIAMVAFVVICFLTEAIPLPGVAFSIGLILVVFGIVSYRDVAAMFWSDACWFIMGSLMFAAAFVKTGVDRRICMVLFRYLARPSVKVVTAILILVIAPAASFISDHALAAMFLPVAMILYSNSLTNTVSRDSELAKMLLICIAMACNIGGFGSPSGGARNVIMMTYLEDMFGINVGYGQWIVYAFPFVLIMMPILWFLLTWRFKPKLTDLKPALMSLKRDIDRMGRWNTKQIIAVVIFLLMLFGWITSKNLLVSLTGVHLGIGVIAIAGAVAYLLSGIVTWRDYQEKVDWGVIWLYAGAIIFGRTLDTTGTAYWMARSVVEGLTELGLATAGGLLGIGTIVTAGLTNLMADGPAAASVGPVTLNMAAVQSPGTTLIPFMGFSTACASSLAYLLVIGTPPNAIVYASGLLQPRDYLRVGVPCFLAALIVLMVMNFFYWPLIGFPGLEAM